MSTAPSARDVSAALALGLLDAPGYGARKVLELLERFGSSQAAWDAVVQSPNSSEKAREHLIHADLERYMQILMGTYSVGGQYKLWNEPGYPANLSKWAGRPPVLFYKGQLEALSTRALALVGRVDPTERGQDAAFRFGRMCVENGIQVISGLAKGIDGASHRAALHEPAGTTFAVVGHGLDFAYPSENHDLYEQIPHHGAILSQFATGVGPQRWTFPARNEAMCTLALGTVIIEGKEGCGSIIQAEFSFKHKRPVFLLSRNLKNPDNGWARKLVDRGAHVIEYFEQAVELVERTNGDLWGEKPTQGTFFDVAELQSEGSMTSSAGAGIARVGLFDLDGVVVDSRGAHTAAVADIASRRLGRNVLPDEVDPRGSASNALRKLGVSDAYDAYRTDYDTQFRAHQQDVRVFDEMVDTLRALREHGVLLAGITSQPARRADVMLPSYVRELFSFVLSYNDHGGKKDAGIAKALKKLNSDTSHSFFVGDQSTDLEGARKAGVAGVGVLWGFSTESELSSWAPDLLLGEPRGADVELLRLLDQVAPH